MQSALEQNWQQVMQQIAEACDNSNRDRDSVTLLAVSKTKPAEMIIELAKAGQSHFGENYLQEAAEKMSQIKQLAATDSDVANVVWHYIGHIQRNKTRDIAENFDWVHTIEREIIAKRLNNQRPDDLGKLNVLIQVNIDNEESKSGCLPNELDELIAAIKGYDKLNLRGLMIIPSKEGTDAFQRTKKLFEEIQQAHPELDQWDTLSMGMSSDMEQAILQGSTMVRVGTAIFGARD